MSNKYKLCLVWDQMAMCKFSPDIIVYLTGERRSHLLSGASEGLLANLASEPLAAARVFVAVVYGVLAAREKYLVAGAVCYQG